MVVLPNIKRETMKWLQRWRKIGYRELWHLHYGGAHEGDKGCEREYRFLHEVLGGWKQAESNTRSLLLEAEQLLRDNGIEPPTAKRWREFTEKVNATAKQGEA